MISKLLNWASIGVPIGFMLSTVYDKVYYAEYGKFSKTFFFAICIIVIIIIVNIIKEILAVEEYLDENMVKQERAKHPLLKSLFLFMLAIGFSAFMWRWLIYVENREIPMSHTWALIMTSWIMGLGIKFLALWVEKRQSVKKLKKDNKEE